MKRTILEAILKSSQDSIVVSDLQGKYLAVSAKKAASWGYADPLDMIGLSDEILMCQEEAQASRALSQKVIETGEAQTDVLQRVMRNGKEKCYSVSKSMHSDVVGGKEIFFIVSISRDITQRMIEIKRNEEIEELVKVEIHAILHEIKGILTGYGGFIGYMISLLKKGKVEKCLNILPDRIVECRLYEERVQSMNLRIAQLGSDKPELPETKSVFDLRLLFNRLIERHQERMQNQGVQLDDFLGLIPEGEYVLETVMAWLAFAIDSVIDNQIKYGEIITKLAYGVEIDTEQNHLLINVSSDGICINEEFVKNKLFKKGQRAKDTAHKEGTGFGLYTAREYIRALGGEMAYIPAAANEWMGFVIMLPLEVLQRPQVQN